eukprot:TRINITY_DN12981_c0_g1_i2.p1 TRINITY_DN12981_c0_g1~~TRINITY_DN12981_c0_g1_i2.p1  ORF type:complete len:134 (-),score=32.28 TRINITY_DN12981_c0_g1_i2:39-383(-)
MCIRDRYMGHSRNDAKTPEMIRNLEKAYLDLMNEKTKRLQSMNEDEAKFLRDLMTNNFGLVVNHPHLGLTAREKAADAYEQMLDDPLPKYKKLFSRFFIFLFVYAGLVSVSCKP